MKIVAGSDIQDGTPIYIGDDNKAYPIARAMLKPEPPEVGENLDWRYDNDPVFRRFVEEKVFAALEADDNDRNLRQ